MAHAPHAAPLAPHCVLDSPEYARHVPEAQQPMHETVPPHEQMPVVQVCPEPLHAAHVAPIVPHELFVCAE